MQLQINSLLSGKVWYEDLSRAEVWVGRSGGVATEGALPDIAVNSRFISVRHLRLKYVGDHWTVAHFGENPTLVNDEPLEAGLVSELKPGDRIRIQDFEFSLSRGERSRSATPSLPNGARLVALEREVHSELLKRMDLRNRDLADIETDATRRDVQRHLQQILSEARFIAGDEETQALARAALYQRLNRLIALAGTELGDEVSSPALLDGSPFEQALRRAETGMVEELELVNTVKSMQDDLQKLDTGFDAIYKRYRLELGPGALQYAVNSLVERDILDLIFGLGPLQDFRDATAISEIMVVSREQIFVEKGGVVEDTRRQFISEDALMSVIERIVAPVGRRVDASTPLVDARLQDGSRVNAVIRPIATKGPCLTIRKFSKDPITIDDMVASGSLSQSMVDFLHGCVLGKKNIVVSGGTGSGKTTMLNALSRSIGEKERVVTIEDTAELQLQQQHVVTLESRPRNMEGEGEVTMRDLVKNALRMRPDRIVVGECRGAEALDMLQAMNTGHSGSMTTGHANSPEDMMLRLETMVLVGTTMPVSAIRDQIVSAVDLVVQLRRLPDGARRVTHISEVLAIDEDRGTVIVEDIFSYQHVPPESGAELIGQHSFTGYIPVFTAELMEKGVLNIDTFF